MGKIGILCACEKELRPFIPDIVQKAVSKYAMHTFYSGKIKGIDIVAVYSGCGKINAAITAQQMIDRYSVDTILLSGIAGGLSSGANIFDTVVCTASEFRDTDVEIYSDFPVLESPVFPADSRMIDLACQTAATVDWPIHFGLTTTGDIFTDRISPTAVCIYMETAAVAHVCHMNNVPFLAIRTISDNSVENGQDVITRNFDRAAHLSYRFIIEMLSSGRMM